MTFAIIELNSHQYLAHQDQLINVTGHHQAAVGSLISAPVLLYTDGQTTQLGQPHLSISATLEVISHTKGEKVEILTYKAKSRYRRHRGYRDHLTQLKVITLDSSKSPKTAPVKKSKSK